VSPDRQGPRWQGPAAAAGSPIPQERQPRFTSSTDQPVHRAARSGRRAAYFFGGGGAVGASPVFSDSLATAPPTFFAWSDEVGAGTFSVPAS
jgi:hypothetical protein